MFKRDRTKQKCEDRTYNNFLNSNNFIETDNMLTILDDINIPYGCKCCLFEKYIEEEFEDAGIDPSYIVVFKNIISILY